jgi:glycosyltransferase involved in cell wall biosynthesis
MFSLITCTVDRTAPLERLLRSLMRQTDRAFELVLVDQNHDNRVRKVIATFQDAFPIVHVRSARGLSLARNKGLELARGDLVAFPDDDCHYPPILLARVRDKFSSAPELAVLTGRTTDTAGNDSLGVFLKQDAQIDRWSLWKAGNSNTVFARRSVIEAGVRLREELGVGASTPFQSGEESAFLLDAIAAGFNGRFYRDIIVYHDQVGETDATRARKYARGMGRVLALYRYPWTHVAIRLMRPTLRALLGLTSLKWRLARYKLSWALGVYEGYTGKPLS